MVRLELIHFLFFAAVGLAIWNIQAKWQLEKRNKALKRKIAVLKGETTSKEQAIKKLSAINRNLITEKTGENIKKTPVLIISEGKGYVKRL